MSYIIKTMSGTIIKVSEEEYKKIRTYKSGLIHLNSGKSFNASSVDSIIPESDYLIENKGSNIGVLHDGQSVIRKFGVWYINDGSFQIAVDPNYYPEIAQDKVFSPQEYEQYKSLPEEEKMKMLPEKREGGGLKKLIKKYDL